MRLSTTNYRFQPQKYHEITTKMRRVADELTGEDRVRLSKIARAALTTGESRVLSRMQNTICLHL